AHGGGLLHHALTEGLVNHPLAHSQGVGSAGRRSVPAGTIGLSAGVDRIPAGRRTAGEGSRAGVGAPGPPEAPGPIPGGRPVAHLARTRRSASRSGTTGKVSIRQLSSRAKGQAVSHIALPKATLAAGGRQKAGGVDAGIRHLAQKTGRPVAPGGTIEHTGTSV